jgi:hypothetical protein
VINRESLLQAKLIRSSATDIKVLAKNTGETIDKKFVFENIAVSKTIQDTYSA